MSWLATSGVRRRGPPVAIRDVEDHTGPKAPRGIAPRAFRLTPRVGALRGPPAATRTARPIGLAVHAAVGWPARADFEQRDQRSP